MLFENNYWFFQSAIPPRICDDIIKFALNKKETMATIGKYQNKNRRDYEKIYFQSNDRGNEWIPHIYS